jgi:cholesterol oxidase
MTADGTLSAISDRLGVLTRTNSEALCGASVRMRQGSDAGFHRGVAITSSIHPDDKTRIEPVRYGKGPQSMGMLTAVMTDGGGRAPRWVRWLGQVLRHPGQAASVYAGLRTWSQRTVIALVMQTEDNSLTLFPKRRRLGGVKLSSRQGHGVPNPTWIPKANEAVRQLAEDIGGMPYSSVGEIFDIPMTAHLLGGCTIGDSPETGVGPYHRMFGHPGLHVMDGSAISANIGVNPSLTITAQAERAMSFWPNVNEGRSPA